MNKTVALIDADSLLYQSSKENIEDSIRIIEEKIYNILIKTSCDYYCLFLSSKNTFRHNVYPEYKANRKKYKSPLKWVKTLREYLIEKYNAQTMNNVEADDLVSYYYTNKIYKCEHSGFKMFVLEKDKIDGLKYEELDSIICSPDKDLLNNFPGKHFDYSYYLKEKDKPETLIEGSWKEVNQQEANKFIWYQMLAGDSADNIVGLYGIGNVTANQWLSEMKYYPEEVLSRYINYYRDISKAIHEYQKNYKVICILKTDEDFIREIKLLPDEINLQINNNKEIF